MSADPIDAVAPAAAVVPAARPPRLGFLGLGWIGQARMRALLDAGAAEVAAVADASPAVLDDIARVAPAAARAATLDELLAMPIDGVVIATPSALHAAQALAALGRGLPVFCQKPLARTAAETRALVDAARRADRLLGCDFSYRRTVAMQRIRQLVAGGGIGGVHAIDLVFHNAYGPDKSWALDPRLAGGGCAIDLGTHLVDLALWLLDFPAVRGVSSRLYAQGRRLEPGSDTVEDHAVAQIDLDGGTVVRLACSWHAATGRDAVIEVHLHGSRGGASMRNRDGSFHDFAAERHDGPRSTPLAEPPDDWGGRTAVAWARRLAVDPGHDPAIETAVRVAEVVDAIYGR